MAGMSQKSAALEDDEILAVVRQEKARAVGFEADAELNDNRETALEYFKGQMDDIAVMPNRSSAVSTDFADAVETVMPDLMEIFTGGDDVATFRPVGEEDEEAAAQETDYVNHVIFNENAGWLAIHSMIKDALTVKLGIVKVWGERSDHSDEQPLSGQTTESVALAEQNGAEIVDLIATDPDPDTGEPLFNCTAITTRQVGRTRLAAVPPEDFAFAKDTVVIADTTYCAMRSRPRAQDLIADGYDADKVGDLSPYGSNDTDGIELARDQGGEHDEGAVDAETAHNLHCVEIIEHYIRLDADGAGKPKIWCVVTNSDESILLDRYEVERIPFAAITPYLISHRLIGQSLYDKLREVQRIRTTLLRMWLDSGYFALNQRYEVAEAKGKANGNTLNDLLNNIPGTHVRSDDGNSVRPLGGGSLGFDVGGAMEFMATVGEQRSGVVRNAQGLNPDTLHKTMGGAMALMGAAQKRVRMIARVFAETGIKDMFLLVHAITRETATAGAKARLRGKWVEVDPTSWGARNDMVIQVGVGSGGREQEMVALNTVIEAQGKLIELQGGEPAGPFVKPQHLYNSAKRLTQLAGLKSPDSYFADPTDPANAPEAKEPAPDPDVVKAQGELELEKYKIDKEDARKRDQMAGEFALERERMRLQARMAAMTGLSDGVGRRIELGGDAG